MVFGEKKKHQHNDEKKRIRRTHAEVLHLRLFRKVTPVRLLCVGVFIHQMDSPSMVKSFVDDES